MQDCLNFESYHLFLKKVAIGVFEPKSKGCENLMHLVRSKTIKSTIIEISEKDHVEF